MGRIFLALACFATLMLAITVGFGYSIQNYSQSAADYLKLNRQVTDYYRSGSVTREELEEVRAARDKAHDELKPVMTRKSIHMLVGIGSALVTLLVNSITVTYFIGTNRWCREVVEAYHLDEALIEKSNTLKRRAFPWAFLSIMTVLVIVALGAASDPGSALANSATFPIYHQMAALLGICFIVYSFFIQLGKIAANYSVIESILELVREERGEKEPANESTAESLAEGQ